jgi:periplasmic copper chaperone A
MRARAIGWGMALVIGFATATAGAHDQAAGDVTIVHPHARATVAAQKNGAAYMTIRNRGTEPERLLAVRTGEARSAELHGTTVSVDGVARMRPAEPLVIPPGGEVKLVPGELHVMLFGLKSPLFEDTTFPMTLIFERAGEVEVEVMVEGAGAGAGQGDHGADHGAGQEPRRGD